VFSRKGILKLSFIAVTVLTLIQVFPLKALSDDEEPFIYGTYGSLNMGNAGEVTHRDFYITLGSKQGIKVGNHIEVLRKIPTHDLLNRRLQKDMIFPIATLKVIHVEQTASIARVDKVYPDESTPAITPHAVMVGDVVRPVK